MKVYIVTVSKSDWEYFSWWIHSIHLNPFEADEAKRKLIADIKLILSEQCPVLVDKDEDGDDILDNLSDYDADLYHKWWYKKNKYEEINIDNISVEEYNINKDYTKDRLNDDIL